MKKIFIFLILICVFLTGCGKNSQSNVTNRIINNYKKSSGYKLDADLEIINNDDVYNYKVESSYSKKNDYYKVVLINKSNDFKQIILKNKEGVFLLTPSMNKSFKFSSDWPYNNSQLYLYNTVISDIENDSSKKFEFRNNKYIYNTKVKYSNNSKLYGRLNWRDGSYYEGSFNDWYVTYHGHIVDVDDKTFLDYYILPSDYPIFHLSIRMRGG